MRPTKVSHTVRVTQVVAIRKCEQHISLRDIQNMPTLWVLALFGIFYKFCFHVQTCRPSPTRAYVYTF